MHIGIIGLGKMGSNMRKRLRERGIEVTGYDRYLDNRDVASLEELIGSLPHPRIVWLMIPAGSVTTDMVNQLVPLLGAHDIVIDGGNTHYEDDRAHAQSLAEKSINFLDCGVSGGVWGAENGYALMVGGHKDTVDQLMPVFDALRPDGERSESFVHVGDIGAGHFAKMVHNGIEYGMMQAFAEGYDLLQSKKEIIKDVPGTFRAWQRGTVIRSWLLDLTVRALKDDPTLSGIDDYVEDSGEGRWTVQESVEMGIPLPVITAALYARFSSRQDTSAAMQLVSALRHQFGGHATKPR